MSKKEVQELIKDNYDSSYYNLFIKKIEYYTVGKQLNFKDFVPKCHQKQLKESVYRNENIWLKI